MENLEIRTLEYTIVEKLLVDLKNEFSRGNNEIIKMVELKKVE